MLKLRRKQKDRRSLRTLDPYAALLSPPPPPPPPPTVLWVVSVTVVEGDTHAADFHFNAAVTCDGQGSGDVVVFVPDTGADAAIASEQSRRTWCGSSSARIR